MEESEKDDKIEIEAEEIADDEISPSNAAGKIKKLKDDLTRSEKERREYLDGWQRAKADFINYKKDEAKRFEELAQFAGTGLMQELLMVLDSFEMIPMKDLPQETEKGILLIRAQMEDVLRKYGLERMEVKAGDGFDPARHETLGEEESETPTGSIATVLQNGYTLRNRVLRPARVKLSK